MDSRIKDEQQTKAKKHSMATFRIEQSNLPPSVGNRGRSGGSLPVRLSVHNPCKKLNARSLRAATLVSPKKKSAATLLLNPGPTGLKCAVEETLFKFNGMDWDGMIPGLTSTSFLTKEKRSGSVLGVCDQRRLADFWPSDRQHCQRALQSPFHYLQLPGLSALEEKRG
ncbi:MAG: hypothetical protein ABIV39_10915, partial [Verrucomicrobiota bacterium]